MSLVNYIPKPAYSCFTIEVFDGTFDTIEPPATRRAPYLYISIDGGASRQTISVEITKKTADQLRELADDAESYWDSWQEHLHPEVEAEDARARRIA